MSLNLLNTFFDIFDHLAAIGALEHHHHRTCYFALVIVAHGTVSRGKTNIDLRYILINKGVPLEVVLIKIFSISSLLPIKPSLRIKRTEGPFSI